MNNLLDNLNKEIINVLDSNGITTEYLITKLKEELNATEIKAFCNKGEIVYSAPLPAWNIKQNARIDAHKLRGDYPNNLNISGSITTNRTKEEIEHIHSVIDQVIDKIRYNNIYNIHSKEDTNTTKVVNNTKEIDNNLGKLTHEGEGGGT